MLLYTFSAECSKAVIQYKNSIVLYYGLFILGGGNES